jgi:hypothetical protein
VGNIQAEENQTQPSTQMKEKDIQPKGPVRSHARCPCFAAIVQQSMPQPLTQA